MIFYRFFAFVFLGIFLSIGCAKITPTIGIKISKDQLVNALRSLDKAEKNIMSFASKGLMEISHISGSQELKFYAVGTSEPFRIRLEWLAMQGLPISTIIVKDHNWLIINYMEKVAYEGYGSCEKLSELMGICPTKSELYSILLGELVLWEYTIMDVDERKGEVSIKLDNDRIITISFDKQFALINGFKDIDKNVLVEFYNGKGNDSVFKNFVKINSGILNPTITLKFNELIKNIGIENDFFEEQIPYNFKMINF